MPVSRFALPPALVLVAALLSPPPATATTLVRQGLERLIRDNEVIVQAKVLDIHSYWNAEHTFILTDVHARASLGLKGRDAPDLTFTVMGGTVGDVTILVVGGVDLVPGSEYVLFLSRTDLPGAADRLTVRDHSQGVFVLQKGRAYSQALREPLAPDAEGRTDVPGGEAGLAIDELVRQVREHR